MTKKSFAIALALTAGMFAAVIQGRTGQAPQAPRAALEIQKVKENLYVIIGNGGNVGVRVTPEGVIVIDDKFEQDYAAITDKIKSVTSQPVKYVINTHQHGDHTGGNAQFLKIAEIISHKNARDNMVKANQPGLARIVFTDQTAVYLGGAEVQAHYLGRGHTNGDAIIYFPDLKVIHTGDLVNEAGPFADYGSTGSILEWPKTLASAMKMDFDTVIPGHGKVMTRAELQTWQQRMDTLATRMTTLVRGGAKKEDIAGKLKADDLVWNLGPMSSFMARSLDGTIAEINALRR